MEVALSGGVNDFPGGEFSSGGLDGVLKGQYGWEWVVEMEMGSEEWRLWMGREDIVGFAGMDGSGSGRYGIIFEMGTGYFLKWVGGTVPFTSSGSLLKYPEDRRRWVNVMLSNSQQK